MAFLRLVISRIVESSVQPSKALPEQDSVSLIDHRSRDSFINLFRISVMVFRPSISPFERM